MNQFELMNHLRKNSMGVLLLNNWACSPKLPWQVMYHSIALKFQTTFRNQGVTRKILEKRQPLDYMTNKTLMDGHSLFLLGEKYN